MFRLYFVSFVFLLGISNFSTAYASDAGGNCTSNSGCKSNNCNVSGGYCMGTLATGAYCTAAHDCASGICKCGGNPNKNKTAGKTMSGRTDACNSVYDTTVETNICA